MIIIDLIFNLALLISVSVLSGFTKKRKLEAGCDDYLSKPVSYNDLLEKLQNYKIVFYPDFLSFD